MHITKAGSEKASIIEATDLDPREEFQDMRVSPIEELESIQIGEAAHQTTSLGTHLGDEEVAKLREADFIEEIKYPEWLANVVLVKKANGKWRMYVNFTDLNKACPKDLYPLPSIDRLINGASGYKTLSFMDAYSGYNQIKMNAVDAPHTVFMSNTCN
ncbi:enzymatic polyprotein, partial [Trifolium medium]|nr:enzymatic polyprotein [Trifolium medium]